MQMCILIDMYVKEDLPKHDLEIKKQLRPVMEQAWRQKKKIKFAKGKLYIDGQVYNPWIIHNERIYSFYYKVNWCENRIKHWQYLQSLCSSTVSVLLNTDEKNLPTAVS